LDPVSVCAAAEKRRKIRAYQTESGVTTKDALIQQDPNLISIDCSMHIKIASISWQGWKIEACEPEIMKLK
jgi:hypothetical protein